MKTQTVPLSLGPELAELINDAFESGNVLLLATVDESHKPHLSPRGSTGVYSETQLSFWARNGQGATIEAIRHNPFVALMYRSPKAPLLEFTGRARIATDEAERQRVFALAHPREQEKDPERRGAAVIIDLDTVDGVLGFDQNGPIFCHMARSATGAAP